MEPLVSIIIPCYNASLWLEKTLASALSQSWANKEILVVDDGSTDSSLSILDKHRSQGIQIFSGPHKNASAARNEGLRHARGEWLQFLDADDLLAPDKIERQMAAAQKEGPSVLLSAEWDRFNQDAAEARFLPQANWNNLDAFEFLQLLWEKCLMMHPAAWLASRPLIERSGPWDERLTLNDDGEFFTRLMLVSDGIVFCPGARSYYRTGNPGSLSRRKDHPSLESLFLSTDLMTSALLNKENTARTRHLCAYAWKWAAFELYPLSPARSKEAEERSRVLGGSSLPFHAGGKFQMASKILGWKAAKRLFCS